MYTTDAFRETVWQFYNTQGRHDLPWRQGTLDPYHVLVSELMLQQTQVPRVIPKYHEFLAAFPDFRQLASAELGDVLRVWSGLGYNRRAKFLWQAAQRVVQQHRGMLPHDYEQLVALPGIGPNTAGAILAYAYNQPTVFLETNIRTVYIHHFFPDTEAVTDKALRALLEQTVDHEHPREWYWALMDYGSYLKQTAGNAARRSKHYVRQSSFEGSRRQVRGAVLRALKAGSLTIPELKQVIADERLVSVLQDLESEQLIRKARGRYRL